MEVSRILLFCVLVAVAYAKVNKSERLMPLEPCDEFARKLGSESLKGVKYEECGENNENGEKLCYRKSVECDSIFDCPNQADEKKPTCKEQHQDYCNTGFPKRKLDGSMLESFACQAVEGDTMCIEKTRECDRKIDCPLGDDEHEKCPPTA